MMARKKRGQEIPPNHVEVYAMGLCRASVCAPKDMAIAEVERAVNMQSPTGISSPWRKSEDRRFHTGERNPCPCPDVPGRVHYLMDC